MKSLYPSLFLLFITTIVAEAQSFYSVRRDRSLILTVGSGTATYFGELSNPGDYLDGKLNINAGLQYFVSQHVSVRGEINWFQLKGDDAKADNEGRRLRNLSFVSNNYEISLTGAIHLFPKGPRFYQRPIINPYAFGGVGFLYFNPTANLNGEKYALRPLMTEGVAYSRSQLVIPYGLGLNIKVSPFINLALEGGYRLTFTDYLDDVSSVHPDKSSWTDPIAIALSDRAPEIGLPPSKAGAIRGNPDTNDGYFLANVKVEYYLRHNFLFKSQNRKLYRSKRKATYRRRR